MVFYRDLTPPVADKSAGVSNPHEDGSRTTDGWRVLAVFVPDHFRDAAQMVLHA